MLQLCLVDCWTTGTTRVRLYSIIAGVHLIVKDLIWDEVFVLLGVFCVDVYSVCVGGGLVPWFVYLRNGCCNFQFGYHGLLRGMDTEGLASNVLC